MRQRLSLPLLSFLVVVWFLRAQSDRVSFARTLTDSTGAVSPGVRVAATDLNVSIGVDSIRFTGPHPAGNSRSSESRPAACGPRRERC